jgi:hypothetical protein
MLLSLFTLDRLIRDPSGTVSYIVVPITAAKLDSKQQSNQETIPRIRTAAVTRSDAATSAWTARRRGKVFYMRKRSPDDSCNKWHFINMLPAAHKYRTQESCRDDLRAAAAEMHTADAICASIHLFMRARHESWKLKTKQLLFEPTLSDKLGPRILPRRK